jgi:hypothetical protein
MNTSARIPPPTPYAIRQADATTSWRVCGQLRPKRCLRCFDRVGWRVVAGQTGGWRSIIRRSEMGRDSVRRGRVAL